MSNDTFIFHGSLTDGPEFNLLQFAGLDLTDEEHDRLWDRTNPRDFLLQALDIDEIVLDDFEGGPGQSDVFYEYRYASEEDFVRDLRKALFRYLGE